MFQKSPELGEIQRSDELSPVKGFHLSESYIPKQQKSTVQKLPVTSGLREASSDSIRLSPWEMPPPNHRPLLLVQEAQRIGAG